MAISQFTVGVSRTVNLGNYESVRVEASLTWDMKADATDADWIAAKELAQGELRALLEQTYRAQYKERK